MISDLTMTNDETVLPNFEFHFEFENILEHAEQLTTRIAQDRSYARSVQHLEKLGVPQSTRDTRLPVRCHPIGVAGLSRLIIARSIRRPRESAAEAEASRRK